MRALIHTGLITFSTALLSACGGTPPHPLATVPPAAAPAQIVPTAVLATEPAEAVEASIQAHAVDPGLLVMVSRFRSMIGHGSYFTPGWSSKHYFVPQPSLAYVDKGVPIHSPVTGAVWRIADERPRRRGDMSAGNLAEESGQQVHIRVAGNDSINVVLYHVTLDHEIMEGSAVMAGQRLGYANVKGNSFDIAIEEWNGNEATYLSYFELMPDWLFVDYQRLGISSREQLVITETERIANPIEFGSTQATEEGWVFFADMDEPQ
jgi:hypothetical protein